MDMLMAAETAADGASRGGYWQLALVLAAIGFLGLFARWRKARTPPPLDTKEFRERDQDPNKYRDHADRAIVELLETSRAISAQVDTKIRMLNRLVKEADDRCAKLEKLLGAANDAQDGAAGAAPPPTASGTGEPIRAAAEPVFQTELHERIFLLKKEGKTVAEIAKATNLSTTEVRFALTALGKRVNGDNDNV